MDQRKQLQIMKLNKQLEKASEKPIKLEDQKQDKKKEEEAS